MKILLCAEPREREAFTTFLQDVVDNNPDENITVIVCGGLLNFMPCAHAPSSIGGGPTNLASSPPRSPRGNRPKESNALGSSSGSIILQHQHSSPQMTTQTSSLTPPNSLTVLTNPLSPTSPSCAASSGVSGPDMRSDLSTSLLYALNPLDTARGASQIKECRGRPATDNALIPVLRDILMPGGGRQKDAKRLALDRYEKLLSQWHSVLNERTHLLCVAGEYDYGELVDGILHSSLTNRITLIEYDSCVVELNGVKIGGLGGGIAGRQMFSGHIPNACPNECSQEDIKRRLKALWGVDILISAIRPEECEYIEMFVRQSPLSVIICAARTDYSDTGREESELTDIGGKCCIYIRPFQVPKNDAYLIDLCPGKLSSLALPVDVVSWSLTDRSWTQSDPVTSSWTEHQQDLAMRGAGQHTNLSKSYAQMFGENGPLSPDGKDKHKRNNSKHSKDGGDITSPASSAKKKGRVKRFLPGNKNTHNK